MREISFVILIRNPRSNQVLYISVNDTDDPCPPAAQFPSVEEAEDFAARSKLCQAWPWCVVEAP